MALQISQQFSTIQSIMEWTKFNPVTVWRTRKHQACSWHTRCKVLLARDKLRTALQRTGYSLWVIQLIPLPDRVAGERNLKQTLGGSTLLTQGQRGLTAESTPLPSQIFCKHLKLFSSFKKDAFQFRHYFHDMMSCQVFLQQLFSIHRSPSFVKTLQKQQLNT